MVVLEEEFACIGGTERCGVATASMLQSVSQGLRDMEQLLEHLLPSQDHSMSNLVRGLNSSSPSQLAALAIRPLQQFDNTSLALQVTFPVSRGEAAVNQLIHTAPRAFLELSVGKSSHVVITLIFLVLCVSLCAFACWTLKNNPEGEGIRASLSRVARVSAPKPQDDIGNAPGALGAAFTRKTRHTISQTRGSQVQGQVAQLCPSLVVPAGMQCVNVVRLAKSTPNQRHTVGDLAIDILDTHGKSVLTAQVKRPVPWCRMAATRLPDVPDSSCVPAISLRVPEPSTGNQTVVATCYASVSPEDEQKRMRIYNANGLFFGHLSRDSQSSDEEHRYVFRGNSVQSHISFQGAFADHNVTATNQGQEIVAHTQPCSMSIAPTGVFYRVTVMGGMDVGIILCALLSIDEMESPVVLSPRRHSAVAC